MVVYADVEIPATGFRIGQAFSGFPDVYVELDRIVPTVDAVIPFIWVRGADPNDVARETREHGAVEQIACLVREDDGALFRVVWNRQFRDTVVSIAESDLALLSGTGTADTWRFELRGVSKSPFSAFVSELHAQDVPVRVRRLTEGRSSRRGDDPDLTAAQFEALHHAYTEGYFEEPRRVTLDRLATDLDISRQAYSGRLRRALATLAADTLGDTRE